MKLSGVIGQQQGAIPHSAQGLRLDGIDHTLDLVVDCGRFLGGRPLPLAPDTPHHFINLDGIVRCWDLRAHFGGPSLSH